MDYLIESKLIHYNLNLDYSNPNLKVDVQSNLLINKIMNDFCIHYGTLFKSDKIFVFYNEDSLISLIEYCILCNIRNITDFNFVIYNKPKRLKNRFNKTDKFISKRELKKNKNNIIMIKSQNPIYHLFDDIIKQSIIEYETISVFSVEPTPAELFCLQIFYGASYQDPYIKSTNIYIEGLNNWAKKPFSYTVPPAFKSLANTNPSISYCWLKQDNDEYNSKVLQEVEKEDTIAFYFYEGDVPKILKDNTYNFLLKRKTNIPAEEYRNLNDYDLAAKFYHYANESTTQDYEIIWPGDWSGESRDKIVLREAFYQE